MKQQINKIISIGVAKHQNSLTVSKIEMLNRMALGAIVLVIVYLVIISYLMNELYWIQVATSVFMCIPIFGTLLLNHLRKYYIARLSMHLLTILLLTVLAILFGYTNDVFLLLMVFSSIYFFENSKTQTFIFFLILSSYLISKYYIFNFESIYAQSPPNKIFTPILYFIFSVVFANFVGRYAIRLKKKYEQKNKELVDSVKSKNQDLLNSNEELERFAYILSHDLKSPIINIQNFAKLSKSEYSASNEGNILTYLDFIDKEGAKMNDLVNSVLQYAVSDKTYDKKDTVDLNSVLQETKDSLQYVIDNKNAIIEHKPLPIIKFDLVQLRTIFQNLIENALKYNESRIPKVEVLYETNHNHFSILFKDNGIGIKQIHHKDIFSLFKRLHVDTEYSGSGIGLSKCKKIIEEHNGSIAVESNLYQGTTFIVSLPTDLIIERPKKVIGPYKFTSGENLKNTG